MDTAAIFDYLYEIETRRSFLNHPPMNLSGRREYEWQDYVHLMRRMRVRFEACVFQCIAENPSFKEELHVIANKLHKYRTFYKIQVNNMPDGVDDSIRLVMSCAEGGLRFLRENYGVVPDASTETRVPDKIEENDAVITSAVISGTQGLADYLGCGKSMAFSIIKSGVLMQQGIQYMVGKSWKFNRGELDKYRREHPEVFAKIRCK